MEASKILHDGITFDDVLLIPARSDFVPSDADKDDALMRSLSYPWDEMGFRMHRGGNNVLFDDGHVALFPQFDKTAMTFHPKEMLDWQDVTRDP